MAGSVGEALAQGIERGMGLGFQIQDRERQAEMDKRRQAESERDFGLQQQQYADQQARLAQQDARLAQQDQWKLLNEEHEDLLSQVTGLQQAGQTVTPELAQRIHQNAAARREHRNKIIAPKLATERQQALDLFSRVQAGEVDPSTLPPAELYRSLSLATGRTPEQLLDAANGAQMVVQGFQSQNQGMTLQGVNKMLASELRAGVGEESPYGGEIVRKEVVHLLPARDASGQDHPDKVMPVVRVYVRRPDAVGPAMQDGAIGYYDAPLTENRSTDPNDKVKVIDLARAFDYMGQLGSLPAVLQDPELRTRLEQGAKEVGEQTKADVDMMTALGRSKLKPEDRTLLELSEPERKEAARIKHGLEPKAAAPSAGVQSLTAKLEDIRARVASGELTPEQGKRMSNALVSGVRSAQGMSYVDTGVLPVRPAGRSGGGGRGAGLAGATTSDKYDKDEKYRAAVNHWAEVVAAGGKMPAGTGRDKEFVRDVNLIVPVYSGGAREQLSNAAEYGGALAGSRAVGTRAANFELAKSEAYEMADLVVQSSASVSRTSFMPINKAIVAFEKNTGDTNVRAFGAALNSFINAYARAVSPIGSPTVSDKNHAREMLSAADSHEQVLAIIAQLKREMVAAGRAPEVVREKQREAVATGLPTTGRGAAPRGPAPGTVEGGYRFKGGNPADKANWEKVR